MKLFPGRIVGVIAVGAGLPALLLASIASAQGPVDRGPDQHSALMAAVRRVVGGAEPCDARQVVLASLGKVVVASLDNARFCNELVIIRGQKIVQELGGWGVGDLDGVITDLDHDGSPELVISQPYSTYEGAMACMATFPSVFRCGGGRCTDKSSRFKDYYKSYLAQLEQERKLLEALPPEMDLRRVPCNRMEIDKAKRLLGTEPEAGLALAEEWMKADDEVLRSRAICVLRDIANPRSLDDLTVLESDSNPVVADFARRSRAAAAAAMIRRHSTKQ